MRPTRIVVGENIERYRKELGMSITQLAAKMGMNATQIDRYENAETNMGIDKLDEFACCLKVKTIDLVEDWED
ncbi:helix-turn-helix domain-containing protein [Pisciglobus halotolerans]|uniref:Helix-turn-helix n=1 Tax=Pisciglobus halotolerans TaxID=745365 RepID=A0A1I3C2Z8_9LACT|nr:helix-turn-helix transcriptional regulator [Pisciglobus halotolerans]SFH68892.1 Helix-turn-helix [Pisciglobus halotolerans]